MNTNFFSLLVTTVSATLVLPVSAQNGPQDLGVEPSLIEQQMQLEMGATQVLKKLTDLTLIEVKAADDEEWDMVRRLERDRQNQSVDAMIQRMVLELQTEGSPANKPDRNPQGVRDRRPTPDQHRRMNESPSRITESSDRQRPSWSIGLVVEPLEPFMREHLSLESGTGVKITRVLDGSPAAKSGIRLNGIIFKAGGRKISSLEDLKTSVEKAGKEGKPLELGWIQKGKRRIVVLHPYGPPRPEQIQRTDKPVNPAMVGLERRMMEMMKRLDRQQKEIEALRQQVKELKPQRMMRTRRPSTEASPNPRSR